MPTPSRVALHYPGEPHVRIVEMNLPDPTGHQVVVRVESTGVCRSELSEMARRSDGGPRPLGHEGVGVVLATGPDVRSVDIGDRVVLSWVPMIDQTHRTALPTSLPLPEGGRTDGAEVFTWATYTLVDEGFLLRIGADEVDPALALLGCAVITGVGSVLREGRMQMGDRVVVIGAGGVGLAAIAGAAGGGASRVVVIDVDESKLVFARRFGATDVIDSSAVDAASAVHKLLQRDGVSGADIVVDCVGSTATLATAMAAVRGGTLGERSGGTVVIAGLGGGELRLDATSALAMSQKRIVGTLGGGIGRREMPAILDAVRSGRIDVSAMVTDVFPLDGLNEAVERLRAGSILGRAVVDFSL